MAKQTNSVLVRIDKELDKVLERQAELHGRTKVGHLRVLIKLEEERINGRNSKT